MKKVMLVKVREGSLKGRGKARKEWCPRRQERSGAFQKVNKFKHPKAKKNQG